MNVISYINGDAKITDYPECSAQPLARMVQSLNDELAGVDGFLSPENSIIVLDLGWLTVGTADTPREIVWRWLADLLVHPGWASSPGSAGGCPRRAFDPHGHAVHAGNRAANGSPLPSGERRPDQARKAKVRCAAAMPLPLPMPLPMPMPMPLPMPLPLMPLPLPLPLSITLPAAAALLPMPLPLNPLPMPMRADRPFTWAIEHWRELADWTPGPRHRRGPTARRQRSAPPDRGLTHGTDTTAAYDHPPASPNALDAIPDDLLDLPAAGHLAFGTTPRHGSTTGDRRRGVYVIRARCVGMSQSERTDGEPGTVESSRSSGASNRVSPAARRRAGAAGVVRRPGRRTGSPTPSRMATGLVLIGRSSRGDRMSRAADLRRSRPTAPGHCEVPQDRRQQYPRAGRSLPARYPVEPADRRRRSTARAPLFHWRPDATIDRADADPRSRAGIPGAGRRDHVSQRHGLGPAGRRTCRRLVADETRRRDQRRLTSDRRTVRCRCARRRGRSARCRGEH